MKNGSGCDFELLTLYHYDEIDPRHKAELEIHLADCAPCRSELERLQLLNTLSWEPTVDQPAVRRIETAVLGKINHRRFRFAVPGLALGGSLIAVLLLLTLRPDAPLPQPEVPTTILTQTEILEEIGLLEELDLLEAFEVLAAIEDLG